MLPRTGGAPRLGAIGPPWRVPPGASRAALPHGDYEAGVTRLRPAAAKAAAVMASAIAPPRATASGLGASREMPPSSDTATTGAGSGQLRDTARSSGLSDVVGVSGDANDTGRSSGLRLGAGVGAEKSTARSSGLRLGAGVGVEKSTARSSGLRVEAGAAAGAFAASPATPGDEYEAVVSA